MRVYIGATRQNDGKTVVSLGLFAALRKRVKSIGYIKPVGQQFLNIKGEKIDKDVVLMSKLYNLKDNLVDMSPVAIPRGFTENYINHPDQKELRNKVIKRFRAVVQGKDIVIVEGTGHAGVGSVFDLSNAKVAKLCRAKVIMVCPGGVGRPIDEIFLNKALFDQKGVNLLGVIINKVHQKKFDKVNTLVRKCLTARGIEVLGVIPFVPLLSTPTIGEVLRAIGGKLISGEKRLGEQAGRYVIGAMPPSTAFDYFNKRYLLITPGNREDIILAAISHSLADDGTEILLTGIIITGGILPHYNILNLIKKTGFPLISVEDDTYTAASKITNLRFKIKPEDLK
ncbi:MAG: AAA family ATPase, partial [Candidatus Auribacterota bacterium]|nr:AAA family ATPase [Candidatus Auribacterota bacterium]